MRKAIKVLTVIYIIPVTFLAALFVIDWHTGHTTPDKAVDKMCTAAMTERLRCYCYLTYWRECPKVLEQNIKDSPTSTYDNDEAFEALRSSYYPGECRS